MSTDIKSNVTRFVSELGFVIEYEQETGGPLGDRTLLRINPKPRPCRAIVPRPRPDATQLLRPDVYGKRLYGLVPCGSEEFIVEVKREESLIHFERGCRLFGRTVYGVPARLPLQTILVLCKKCGAPAAHA